MSGMLVHQGLKAQDLKVAELKYWLSCRGAPTKGKKADLVARVNALIKYGFNKDVQNPDGSHSPVNPQPSGESLLASPIAYPQQGWEDISTAFSSLKGVLQFNTSHIVTYFVNRSVSDGLPASDFKSVNNSAEYLFRCGHVQAILVCSNEKYLFIKAKCLPEMRKDRVYLLNMALIRPGCDIVSAECGCPAGKGPQGSCKHVGALSYALSDICRIQVLPQYHTCTDQLQQWNQPRERHINPIPVDQLGSSRRELLPPRKRATGSIRRNAH